MTQLNIRGSGVVLSEIEKGKLRESTHEAALVLLDDLEFMRGTLAKKNPTAGDVRRVSVILRRLLLDGHLAAVGGPRLGRIKLIIPDNRAVFVSVVDPLVVVGIAPMFQIPIALFGHLSVEEGALGVPPNIKMQMPDLSIPGREVNIEGLLADNVARYRNQFVTRGDVLKFICYQAFAAHYAGREVDVSDIVRHFRFFVTFESMKGTICVTVNDPGTAKRSGVLMDFAHALTLSLGYYITQSPNVLALEALIKAEALSG